MQMDIFGFDKKWIEFRILRRKTEVHCDNREKESKSLISPGSSTKAPDMRYIVLN